MREVSSPATLAYKLLVPWVSVALSAFFIIELYYYSSPTPLVAIVGTLMVIAATVFVCWFAASLKQVRLDEHYLYVAGVFKEISIPITNIASVGGFYNGSPVILRLKEKSEFGRTIFFVAEGRPLVPWEVHPIFAQLGELIRETSASSASEARLDLDTR